MSMMANALSAGFWRDRAITQSEVYLRTQAETERVEAEVLAQSGNRQVMKTKLRDHYDPETGRMYQQLCDKRDVHMAVATHAALMAMMLRG